MMSVLKNKFSILFMALIMILTFSASLLIADESVAIADDMDIVARMGTGTVQSYDSKVVDGAGVLTADEISKLAKLCEDYSKKSKVDIVIMTTATGLDNQAYANYLQGILESNYGYNGSGNDCDAVVFGIDMISRADRIIARGEVRKKINDSTLQKILDSAESNLSAGKYYKAFEGFVKGINSRMSTVGKLMLYLPIKILIALVVALIAVAIMAYNAKAHMTVADTTYTKDNQFKVVGRDDHFINTTVEKRKIESSSSSSGSSGGHSGSVGGHF